MSALSAVSSRSPETESDPFRLRVSHGADVQSTTLALMAAHGDMIRRNTPAITRSCRTGERFLNSPASPAGARRNRPRSNSGSAARRGSSHEVLVRDLASQSLAADRAMTRHDWLRWLERHNYPLPPKSACIGCPFHSDARWRDMRDNDADAWADAVDLDRTIRTGFRGIRSEICLHRSAVLLDAGDLTTDADRGQLDLCRTNVKACAAREAGFPHFRRHGFSGCSAARE